MVFTNLEIQPYSSTRSRFYSLYWSENTPNEHFNGQTGGSYLCVWEAGAFNITATRVMEPNIPSLRHPPGQPGRFDGRLRGVSIYLKLRDSSCDKRDGSCVKIVGAGVRGDTIIRGRGGHLLKSHEPQMVIKTGSFWEYENSQMYNQSCIGYSKYLPGCFNSTDPHPHDNSSFTLTFQVGLASPPHGIFGDGIISVSPTRFAGHWDYSPDYSSTRQSFFLFILRMLFY